MTGVGVGLSVIVALTALSQADDTASTNPKTERAEVTDATAARSQVASEAPPTISTNATEKAADAADPAKRAVASPTPATADPYANLVKPVEHRLLKADELSLRVKLYEMAREVAATSVSPTDIANLKKVAAAAAKRQSDEAHASASEIRDPIARKLAVWLKLRAGLGTLSAYRAFLASSPLWPSRELLIRRMEDNALTLGGAVAEIDDLFNSLPPQTGPGLAAHASAKRALGDVDGARKLASEAWRKNRLARNLETGFLERFGDLLTPEDHLARADLLLGRTYSRRARRSRRADAVRRLLPRLSPDDQKTVTARL
ncbi:MAG: hypothetical protein AAFY64_11075, partial [Pseudomonadota bacterium]